MNDSETRQQFLHKTDASILRTLRRAESARFSELMRPTGLTSDDFKFYTRRLLALGWIEKTAGGTYRLTVIGKELANNLNESKLMVQKQPKLSTLLVISRQTTEGSIEYLFQQRLRQPYYGFWGLLSGPVLWGESIEQAATMELRKQTDLVARCTVRSFCRQADRGTDGLLLEDKLFAVVEATNLEGNLADTWSGGNNCWATMAEFSQFEKVFPRTLDTIELVRKGQSYATFSAVYHSTEY